MEFRNRHEKIENFVLGVLEKVGGYWRIIRKGKKTWVNTQHDVICLEQGKGICSLDLKSHAVGYMINSNKLVSYLIEIQLVFFPFCTMWSNFL